MGHVCEVYLAHSKATDKPATFVMRGGFLFDFCTGLPARFWDKGTGKEVQAPSRADYLHKGYATREVSSILPLDVQSWLDKHKGWTEGTKRIAIQAVRRAMNYAREMKLIPENPIKGIKIPKANARITYLTPEQERAIAENTYKAFAILVYVCIRTGGRPISEVSPLPQNTSRKPPTVKSGGSARSNTRRATRRMRIGWYFFRQTWRKWLGGLPNATLRVPYSETAPATLGLIRPLRQRLIGSGPNWRTKVSSWTPMRVYTAHATPLQNGCWGATGGNR